MTEGVALEEIADLSVFAFARLPLLVYLGAHLDDNVPTDIYQRHRATERWEWPDPGADVRFRIDVPEAAPDGSQAAPVMNVSGSIEPDEVPGPLAHLSRLSSPWTM